MQVQVRIKNLPQIRAAFGMAPRAMSRELSTAVKKSTLLVRDRSKIHTPVRTGFLRNSHVTRFSGGGLSFAGTVEPTAYYAPFVHEGTRFQKAQPFLRQGLYESEPQIQQLFLAAVQNVLNQIGRMT